MFAVISQGIEYWSWEIMLCAILFVSLQKDVEALETAEDIYHNAASIRGIEEAGQTWIVLSGVLKAKGRT